MDAELRAVPLPDGFLERLRPSVLTDEELDCARAGRASARWFGRPVATVARAITLAGEELGLCEAGQPMGGGPVAVGRPGGGTGRHPGGILAVREASGAAGGFCGQRRCGPRAGERRRGIGRSPSRYAGYARTCPAAGIAAIPSLPTPMMRFNPKPRPYHSWIAEADARFGFRSPDPLLDTLPYRWGGVFASHRPFDELPELKKAPGLTARGIEWPLVAGANNAFSDSLRRTPVCLAGVESATAEHRGSAGG